MSKTFDSKTKTASKSTPEISRFMDYGDIYMQALPEPLPVVDPNADPNASGGAGNIKGNATKRAAHGSRMMSADAHARALNQPARNTNRPN